MSTKYRFSINGWNVNPIYKDDISKDFELETDQRFYRAKLSGSLVFIKDDFDWLKAQAFDTMFVLLIERYLNGVWSNYLQGVFYKTDGKWDDDNKSVTIKTDAYDQYTEVLAGYENEYNLIKLAPAKTPLQIQKRPLIQLYIPGDTVVSCFLGGNYWEQDAAFEVTDTGQLTDPTSSGGYAFALASTMHKVFVSGTGTPAECVGDYVAEGAGPTTFAGRNILDVAGEEIYQVKFESLLKQTFSTAGTHGKTSSDLGSIWADDNGYYWQLVAIPSTTSLTMCAYFHAQVLPEGIGSQLTHVRNATNTGTITYDSAADGVATYLYSLRRTSDSAIMFASKEDYAALADGEINFVADQGTGTLDGYKSTIEVYMRYLLDVDTILGLTTQDLPADDIVENNRNYSKCIGYAIDQVTITPNANQAATEYGIMDDGYYFVEPPGFPTYYKYFPVARSTWGYSSLWFNFDLLDELLETAGRKAYTMKDSMLISDVIKVLLAEIDPTISHDGTSDYSEFLYGTINPITLGTFRVMLTQKSNVLAGEYDRPAQKAPATLSSIMAMLRDTMKLYWYIEDSKFKIEHVEWFKNGGSYSSSSNLTADLTTLTARKNAKKWGLYTSNYEYDKQDLAERIEFAWMDEVTEGFEGVPIEINSKFVQRGKKDSISVSEYTTDVDYMLLNPGAINQDGFALFAAIDNNLINFNASDVELGYVLATSGGTTSAYSLYNTTGFVEITEGETYYASYVRRLAFYDSSKTWISNINLLTHLEQVFEAPANAAYVRICVGTDYWDELRLVIGNFNVEYKLPFIERTINDADLRLQNGLMSWIYLQPNFWTYDLPASDVTINEDPYTVVYGIERKKKQTVIYPSTEDPDPYKLIKTYLGNGQIDKLSINLSSRMNEIQLKYDTE